MITNNTKKKSWCAPVETFNLLSVNFFCIFISLNCNCPGRVYATLVVDPPRWWICTKSECGEHGAIGKTSMPVIWQCIIFSRVDPMLLPLEGSCTPRPGGEAEKAFCKYCYILTRRNLVLKLGVKFQNRYTNQCLGFRTCFSYLLCGGCVSVAEH